jgi:hypothetical protein
MPPRKPADPRDDVQRSNVLREHGIDLPGDSLADRAGLDHETGEEEGRHVNVEVESGPVDREERDDPLPEAP